MNNKQMSLMLLTTLKIVSCLKNYCYHNDDNTHIENLLNLLQSLQKHVLSEFEYQLQLEFDIFFESTINSSTQMNIDKKSWNYSQTLSDESKSI